MIRAIGDAAFVIDARGARILGARGLVAEWPEIFGHTALAHPPRLAIVRRDRSLALIDVDTGEVQRDHRWAFAPLAFSLDGRKLFVADPWQSKGVAVASLEGPEVVDECVRPLTRLVLSRADWFAGRSGDRVIVVGVHPTRGYFPVGAAGNEPIAFDVEGARLLTLERTAGGLAFTVFHAHVAARVEGAVTLAVRTRPIAMWCDATLDEIAALDVDGRVLRAKRSHPTIEFTTQRPQPRTEDPGLGVIVDVDHDVRVDGARGSSLVDPGRSLDVCFTPAGACVVVRDGRAFTVDDAGRAVGLEGPTNLVSITPHPRGVLAVDDEERAHVIEIGDDEAAAAQVSS